MASGVPLPEFDPSPAFRLTSPPKPDWKTGDGITDEQWKEDEKQGWKEFDPEVVPGGIYKLMVGGVIPRPIAFVSSLDTGGIGNLAPFSWFNMAASDPPLITISCSMRAGSLKDTSKNILETKEFTVNIISEAFVHAAAFTAVDGPPELDEWIGSGLTREPSKLVKPPRVRESAFSMECELYHSVKIASPKNPDKTTGILIIGLVKLIHVRNSVLRPEGDTVDPQKLRAVSRLGDISFGRIGEGFRIPRPSVDVVQREYAAMGH